MAQTYTRQSSFSDGDTITAALFNNEYNQLVNAFAYHASTVGSTGHRHDGTAAQGGNIHTIGDLDFLNKIMVSSNTWEFYVEVSSAAAKQMILQDGALVPNADSDLDLGTSSVYFKNAYIDAITTTGNVSVGGNLDVTGTIDFSDSAITNVSSMQLDSIAGDADSNTSITFSGSDVITIANAGTSQVTFNDGSIVPVTDNDIDLGTSSLEFKDAYFDGTVTTDALVADTADINGGTVDGAIIGGSSAAAITGTAITGTSFVIGSANISEAELETIDGITAGTVIASKAIITDSNIDITGGRNITISGELDAATLDISGNADIDGTTNLDVVDIDGAVDMATTLAVAGNVDFNGDLDVDGTTNLDVVDIDGAVDMASTLAVAGVLTGASLDISGDIDIDGTSNLDIVDIDGAVDMATTLTVGGEITAASLDISGNVDIDGTLETDALTIDGTTLAETISDTVGAMVSSNTETNITVTYEDSDNTLDFVIGTLNQDTTGLAATATALATARTIGGTSFDGTANIAVATATEGTNVTVSANNSTDETVYPTFVDGATGTQGIETDTGLTYNPSTGMLTSTGVTSTFTGNVTGNVTGNTSGTAATVTTAAQSNITSLGTLTTLTVDNVVIDGAVIGHTSDTDLITLSSGVVTVAGEVDATSLDISGDADIDGTLEADAITVGGSTLASVIAGTTVANATLAATATVTDSTANTNFPVVFHNESDGLLDDTGALRYNPSTGELLVPKLTVAGTTTTADTVTMQAANAVIFEGATADAYETTLSIVDPTADHTQYLINQGGYIPVLAASTTTAITSTPAELNALDGITAVVGELNALDIGSTAVGTAVASKAVILDSNKDYTGLRNLTITGELDAATLDISGNVDIDGAVDMATTLAVAGNVDFNGDLDVDGTTNLDVVDIDGAVNMATTALVTGVLTTTATQVATGGITSGSTIISDTDSTDSLGSTGVRWLKGWFDTLTAGTLTIGSGSVTDSSGAISFGDIDLTNVGTIYADQYLGDADANSGIVLPGSDVMTLHTAGSERMRILAGGNVFIGDDSFGGSGAKLAVQVPASGEGAVIRVGSTADAAETLWQFIDGADQGIGAITGNPSSNTTAYGTSSDYRLKENVSYTWDATTRLKQLKPARFNWIKQGTSTVHDGFLAHEVSAIVPSAIVGAKDAVDENDDPKYQQIDQAKLVPLLVKTIQELEARITALES